MHSMRSLLFLSVTYLFATLAALFAATVYAAPHPNQGQTTIPKPFFFTENKGQWDSRVLYKCQAKNGMTWFLERDGITLLLTQSGVRDSDFGDQGRGRPSGSPADGELGRGGWQPPAGDAVRRTFLSDDVMENDLPELLRDHRAQKNVLMKSHALKFHFVKGNGEWAIENGATGRGGLPRPPDSRDRRPSLSDDNVRDMLLDSRTTGGISYRVPNPEFRIPCEAQSVEALGELPWKNNYFLGNDSSKWAPNCRNFSTVVYREVWDGIDIEWYENDGKLEFDFVVHPGFDPSQIRMSVEGLEGDRISGFGAPETGLSLRERPATKQSHLGNGNREQGTGNSRGVPRTPDGNVRALLRDARTTGGNVHLQKMSDGVKDNSRGVWHTPDTTEATRADVGVRPYPSPNTQYPSPIAQHPLPITELLLPTSLGELRTALPSVYQVSANGTRNEINAAFQLTDQNTFGITLPDGYNPDHSLRIDPLIYSSFLGGSGNDFAYTVSNDGLNGIIVSGYTASVDFPTSIGAIDTSSHGLDCFVSRLNLTNQQLIYSTYLGGSNGDYGTAIANESNGNCTVTGITMSTDYPTTPGVGDLQLNGTQDCFVAHLNSTGSQLLYSTYLGGSNEERPYDIAVDNSDGVFVVGTTNSQDYPTTNNAWCRFFIGGSGFPTWGGDCFITHINSTGSQLIYSSYFGGTLDDVCGSIYVSPHLEVTVTGWTTSSDFPVTAGVYDSVYSSNSSWNGGECFISCFDSSSSNLLFSTFLGQDSVSGGVKVIREENGNVLIAGETYGDFPVTQGAYDTTFNGEGDYGGDLFIARLNSNASQLLQSTYVGGTVSDQLQGMEKLENGQIAVFGTTYSSDIPTTNTAISSSLHGRTDSFLSILNSDLSTLVFGSYIGGSGDEGGRGICLSNNQLIIVGGTGSQDFPMSISGFDTTYNGGTADCFICLFQTDSTGVTSSEQKIPNEYLLSQNYPNPFNSSTTISYSLPKPGHVNLRLFDITGREVATLVNQKQLSGSYRVTFDGQHLSSGTYFVRMQAGEFVKTQKMVLLR